MRGLARGLRALAVGAALIVPHAALAAELPPPAVLLALLRGTMSALNQANVTGNYSVLRDLAAPVFRDANSSAALADRFRVWRERQLDFAAVLLLDAELAGPPAIAGDGTLHLSGRFPTAPLRVGFQIVYQPVNGNWRLSAIQAEIIDPDVTGSIAQAPAAARAPAASAPAAAARPVEAVYRIPTPPMDRPRS